MADRWIVGAEGGTWYLLDMVGMTVMGDGSVPVDLLAVPTPWPPVVGEPLRLLVAIQPGTVTARTTTRVVEVTESDD